MRSPEVLGPDLAERLRPFVSKTGGDYFFWNYASLEAPEGGPTDSVSYMPRVLVQLRGIVTGYVDGQPRTKPENRYMPSQLRLVMDPGSIETIEFLSEEWLRAWRDLFRLGPSPFSVPRRRMNEENTREMAPRVLEILLRMKKHSTITEEMREKVAEVDQSAQPTVGYQLSQEGTVHRWLVEVNEKYDLNLKGIQDLGDVPPGPEDLREWFLAASDKQTFLEVVQSHWKGDIGVFSLVYYVTEELDGGGKVTHGKSVGLDDLLQNWSDEEFPRHQSRTREMLEASERARQRREEKKEQERSNVNHE